MKTENTYIIHPEIKEQEKALKAFIEALKIKFEITNKTQDDMLSGDTESYDPEFIAKIQESRKQAEEGKITRINKDKLQDFLGLE